MRPAASRPRAAVIGAGVGGLALAARLQGAGYDTVVFEKRDKPGGSAYVHEQDGYVFDAGPTVITDPSAFEEVFAACGRRLADYAELLPVSPFYRLFWPDGALFDYVNDQQALERQIARLNPDDVEGYRRFLSFSAELMEEGYVRHGSSPFLTFGSMVKVAPRLIRLQSFRSVHAMVSRFVADPRLRQALSFHALLLGGHPFRASAIYALIHALERRWGVFFPKGGTGALIRAMARLIADLGGEVRTSSPVQRILTEGDRAVGVVANGVEERFDLVVSNAPVMHTYGSLLDGHRRGVEEARRLADKRFSMSLFVVYFGARRVWPGLAHHSVLFGPRWRPHLDEVFDGPALPEDFSLYLHAPTVTDPSLAPEGCTGFYALSPVPNLGAADIDWETEAPRYRDRMLAALEERLLPGLRASIETCRVATPEDFRRDMNCHLGATFSLEPVLTQSAWFRPHNRDAVIRNLYLVGAATHPGAGLPGVLGSAKATAGLILAEAAQEERAA